jgi:hypothetical protein
VAQELETPAQPAVETVQSAQPSTDLDTLLGEYDAQTKQPAPVATPQATQPELQQLRNEVEAIRRETQNKREVEDRKSVISEVRGDFPAEDYAVRGWLSDKAEADPRINEIWNNRQSNPQAAKKLVVALKSEFAKEQAKKAKAPDANATEDRLAVAQAVRGTSTRAPEQSAPNYGQMNDADFAKEKAKYGF